MNPNNLSSINRVAWSTNSYAAWVNQYGTPAEVAEKIKADPAFKLRRLINHLPALKDLNIANPLGSHGRIATALAVLDASELASAAGVKIDYVLGEFQSTALAHAGYFNAVVMELGIVHYFADITHFVAAVRTLLPEQGLVVLNEFHPLLGKSILVDSGDISLRGDYFSTAPKTARTPFEGFVDDDVPTCLIRQWNLGEIVTAFASGGFRIQRLVEHLARHGG